jgi:3-hydroxybutyryl-CoA dehydrogenase
MPLSFDPNSQSFTLAVIGSGAMGRGIAQIAAQAGIAVLLFDTNQDAVHSAQTSIKSTFARLVEKNKMQSDQASAAVARITGVASLAALAKADLIVEAIVENLAVKRQLFAELEPLVDPSAVLASNTSSLSVTAIGATMSRPERFLGWHFFNPVPLMRVVEVVDGARTDRAVGDAMMALSRRLGHTPVRAKDTPGFIVNHAGRGFGTEALQIVSEGVCDFVDVDRIMREACGFRLGPFELMDLTGLDVSHPVMESIFHQYYEEPRFRPSVIAAQRHAAGLYGKKTGRGFYDYASNAAAPTEAALPTLLPARIYISRADPKLHDMVSELLLGKAEQSSSAADADVQIVMPLGHDATHAALSEGLDATRVVAFDTLTPPAKRRTLMTTPVTTDLARDLARGLFGSDGVPVTTIRDSAGFVAQRILSMIVNISSEIAQQGIASPSDIDLAVHLGLNYPSGPLALGDALGATRIVTILKNIEGITGDPRYRASAWLRRRAGLGISLLTEEGRP